jgi:hypothetical protein
MSFDCKPRATFASGVFTSFPLALQVPQCLVRQLSAWISRESDFKISLALNFAL